MLLYARILFGYGMVEEAHTIFEKILIRNPQLGPVEKLMN